MNTRIKIMLLLVGIGGGGWLGYHMSKEAPELGEIEGPVEAARMETSSREQTPGRTGENATAPASSESEVQVATSQELPPPPNSSDEPSEDSEVGLPDSEFTALLENPSLAEKFLQERRIKSLAKWREAQPFPHQKFQDGDMLGLYFGELDGNKGSISIQDYGSEEEGVFKGRYVFKMHDPTGKRITESASFSNHMAEKMRFESNSRALLLNAHDDARYFVQIFRGSKDKVLIGNVYQKTKGQDEVQFFASFKAKKR